MSHTSPASYLVWSTMSVLLFGFLLYHLWSFDRFQCLKWNHGPYSGAFKRVMTYSYLASIPLIMTYSVGFAIIKYEEGFSDIPFLGVVPKPWEAWGETQKRAIFPLTLMFSIGWSLEMVTHLEELCFWLFLVNAGSAQQDWFRSSYFKTWLVGSCVAVTYMPIVTIVSRENPLKGEAYTFLAGSLGSLSLTLWFTPILWAFPAFLNNLKTEGVDSTTIVRLTKFHELNTIRVVFRFMFVLPLIILGIDGVRPHVHVNESMFWTDLLTIIAAFGCGISSGLTLVIFFPRSVDNEIAAREASREKRRHRSTGKDTSMIENRHTHTTHSTYSQSGLPTGRTGNYLLTSSPVKHHLSLPSDGHVYELGTQASPLTTPKAWTDFGGDDEERDVPANLPNFKPNRRRGDDVELGGFRVVAGSNVVAGLTEGNLSMHNLRQQPSSFNPIIHNFTSPIDLAYGQTEMDNRVESRLTFNRR